MATCSKAAPWSAIRRLSVRLSFAMRCPGRDGAGRLFWTRLIPSERGLQARTTGGQGHRRVDFLPVPVIRTCRAGRFGAEFAATGGAVSQRFSVSRPLHRVGKVCHKMWIKAQSAGRVDDWCRHDDPDRAWNMAGSVQMNDRLRHRLVPISQIARRRCMLAGSVIRGLNRCLSMTSHSVPDRSNIRTSF